MQIIPLESVPSQQFSIGLNGQNCLLSVYQKSTGLYFDVSLNGAPIALAVRCLNCARLLADRQYAGLIGDFMFVDTTAQTEPLAGEDPVYTGLGAQFDLWYLEASDVAAFPN